MSRFNPLPLFVVAVLAFLPKSLLFAQTAIDKATVQNMLKNNAITIGLSNDDLANTIITAAYHDKLTNVDLLYLQQSFKGIPVYNAIQTVAVKDDKVVSVTGTRIGKMETRANVSSAIPSLPTMAAVAAAAKHLKLVPQSDLSLIKPLVSLLKTQYGSLGISKSNVVVQLLWLPKDSGSVRLTWQVEIDAINSDNLWLVHVDAASGNVLGKVSLTVHDNWGCTKKLSEPVVKPAQVENRQNSELYNHAQGVAANTSATYRVIPFPAESLKHSQGTTTLVTDPWNAGGTSNAVAALGWQNDGSNTYNITRGNNVWVKEDRASDDENTIGSSATSTTSTPNLTFDFALDTTASPVTTSNQRFAITNLFYWNNITHDVLYQYGFDEVSGNFQNNNQGRGGLGADYVVADAQDGSGLNNANFTTPVDGQKPRMQMYLFNPSPNKTLLINSPSGLSGYKYAPEGSISYINKLTDIGPVTGNVVLYGNTATSALGCDTVPSGSFTGKIVLIFRGSCDFIVKVKNAQTAGAAAVIIANNTTESPFEMGGTNNSITIPAVMVSQSDGNDIRDSVSSGKTVNVTFKKAINLDGDLDNGIIVHEYGHGVSTRLTGGPANSSCLDNVEQMGEGWSDYYTLMLNTDWSKAKLTDGPARRPLATYAYDQDPVSGESVRIYPYSTDMTINPWTYSMIATNTGGETHEIGELWAAVLWDMTWNIIALDGVINPNLYNASAPGGNSVSMKLVNTGLKLQSCSPGFLDGRDAILKADTLLYNGKYSCAIWKAFARRGMGFNAKQGSSNSYTDQTEGTALPSAAIVRKLVDKSIASENEEITYKILSVCQCTPITNYKVVDTLPNNVTYVSGGTYSVANRTVTFNIPTLAAYDTISFSLKVTINKGSYTDSVIVLNDSVSIASIPNRFIATTTPTITANNWLIDTLRFHSAKASFRAIEPTTVSEQILTSANSFPLSGLSTLSFWHTYNTELGYDGGTVEISTDSGTSWIDLGPYMYQNGYNATVLEKAETIRWFSGSTDEKFIQTKVNLSSFGNKTAKIRFHFYSDNGTGGRGWIVDDIVIKNEAAVYNAVRLFNSTNQLQSIADIVTTIRDPKDAIVWTGATNSDWNLPSNWQGNVVPTKFRSARIAPTTNQPVLTTDASCLDLILETGTTLTIPNKYNLSVYGNVIK